MPLKFAFRVFECQKVLALEKKNRKRKKRQKRKAKQIKNAIIFYFIRFFYNKDKNLKHERMEINV